MNSKDYQEKAKTFDREYENLSKRLSGNVHQMRLIHAIMGMSGEVGETVDAVKKHILYDKTLDIENLKEECGDILWYMSLMLNEIDSSFEEVMQININKLSKRYPTGFTEEHAKLRMDKT